MKIAHLVGFTVFAIGAGAAHAEADAGHCSLATLHGTLAYAFVSSEPPQSSLTPTVQLPTSSSGEEYYDGKGHMKYFQYVSYGGTSYNFYGTGTYTITANCLATVTYEYQGTQSGSPWVYFVVPDGSGYYWNDNQNTGTLSAGRSTRISLTDLLP